MIIKNLLTALNIIFTATNLIAQKLPNLQSISVRAPADIKIDGKSTEWNNKFQAYNKSAAVFYTLSNDDQNLYLAIQAKDLNVINTIVGYGAEFVIQKSVKKDEKDKISICYPVAVNKKSPVMFGGKSGLMTDTSEQHSNDIMNSNNKTLARTLKWIIVKGIKGLDTLSIYNDEGIRAAGQFDNKLVYTFEISVRLDYLGLSVNAGSKFSYHIIFNGYTPPDNFTMRIPPNSSPEYIAGMEQAMVDLNVRISRRNTHTDFWGEYTLAKKP